VLYIKIIVFITTQYQIFSCGRGAHIEIHPDLITQRPRDMSRMRNKEKARAKDKSKQYEQFVDEALKLLTTPEEVEKWKQQNNSAP
jgi:hypothetical protein